MKFAVVPLFLGVVFVQAATQIPEFKINLDLKPEDRFTDLIPTFNASVWAFYDKFFAKDVVLRDVLYDVVDKRGEEPAELAAEIRGLASASKLPLKFVQGVQMLYELQTLMVPVENITQSQRLFPLPKGYEALSRLPRFGCTGIIATAADGSVAHARNLDFSPSKYFAPLVYTGIFTKGGKEVFRSQMVAGYQPMVTGMKMGKNGFTIERNTRYPDHVDGNKDMFHYLLGGRPLNGWMLRKILEHSPDYDNATAAIKAAPYVSTEYAIVSGVRKGTIISRDPDRVAYVQTLGKKNFEERDDYIIMTNFDFFFHDFREYFDPTGGKIGYPRRIAAQKLLNSTVEGKLTPEFLYSTIDAKGVLADTIFQAVMNVEKGLWNVTQPQL